MALPIMLLIEFCLVYTILSIARNKGETPTLDRYDNLVSISFGILTSVITQGISYFLCDYSNNEADAGEVLAVLGFVPAIILITQLCRFAKNKLWYQRARLITQTFFLLFWIVAIFAYAPRPGFLYGIQFAVYAYFTGGFWSIEALIALIRYGRRHWHKRYAIKQDPTPLTFETGGEHD